MTDVPNRRPIDFDDAAMTARVLVDVECDRFDSMEPVQHLARAYLALVDAWNSRDRRPERPVTWAKG